MPLGLKTGAGTMGTASGFVSCLKLFEKQADTAAIG